VPRPTRALAALAVVGLLAACATSQTGSPQTAQAPSSQLELAPPSAPSTSSTAPASAIPTHSIPAAQQPPAPNHCAGNAVAQLVKVSIKQQHLWLCAGSRTMLSTAITSGATSLPYDSTPLGNFLIQARNRNTVLTLNTGAQYTVKYWIPFSGPLFGFHDSPWQTFPYGSARYRTEGSHGCIHMPLKAIAYLYEWARVGASVHIRA
jgi:lipoprotein-anchoring transpeptidase ErfK/SrfK